MVFAAMALPLTYLPILIIANDPDYMGDQTNGRVLNFLGLIYLGLLLVASIAAIPLMIITKAGHEMTGQSSACAAASAGSAADRPAHAAQLLGKVDDVELDLDADPPVVSALISGRQRIPAVADDGDRHGGEDRCRGELNLTRGRRLGRAAHHRQDPRSRRCD